MDFKEALILRYPWNTGSEIFNVLEKHSLRKAYVKKDTG